VTIGTLPDDVLLKIFKFFVNVPRFHQTPTEKWCMVVHVCQRWRNLAFTFPRHLGLQLVLKPPNKTVERMLDIWPELPIYIPGFYCSSSTDRDNVAAALRLNHRVSGFCLEDTPDPVWDIFGPLMKRPFPTLTHLWIRQLYRPIENTISHPFLGGSAPSLRELHLDRIPFLELPNLLLSCANLVRLSYVNISPSGYISPQAMATGLSALTQLESLSFKFLMAQPFLGREIQIPPSHMPILLPSLTYLDFQGAPDYMEYLAPQIHGQLLEIMYITFSRGEVVEISEFAKFVHRADKLSSADRGEVTFESDHVSFKLSQNLTGIDPKTLILNVVSTRWNFQPSYLAQFWASWLPIPSPFESLHIFWPVRYVWEEVISVRDAPWLELMRPFDTVKHLHLSRTAAPLVTQFLRRLPPERGMEVLPALESVFISDFRRFGPMNEAMTEFARARQLSGHPVSIYGSEGPEGAHPLAI
jgi:hypothetical protein